MGRLVYKKCKRCEEDKPIEEYDNKTRYTLKDGTVKLTKSPYCRVCRRLFGKESAERKPYSWIATRFRIPQEEAMGWYQKTMESCEICGTEWQEGQHKLCIDHDHNTGKIRGILCKPCNHVLGHSYDNIDTLESAIAYLKRN